MPSLLSANGWEYGIGEVRNCSGSPYRFAIETMPPMRMDLHVVTACRGAVKRHSCQGAWREITVGLHRKVYPILGQCTLATLAILCRKNTANYDGRPILYFSN